MKVKCDHRSKFSNLSNFSFIYQRSTNMHYFIYTSIHVMFIKNRIFAVYILETRMKETVYICLLVSLASSEGMPQNKLFAFVYPERRIKR